MVLAFVALTAGQSRNNSRSTNELDGTVLNVTAWRTKQSEEPIRVENLHLYENGIEQKIKNFSYDPSPARIVLLVDNSQTLLAVTADAAAFLARGGS